jgi:hypothetical protein
LLRWIVQVRPLLNPKPTAPSIPALLEREDWTLVAWYRYLAREGRMTVTIGRRELLAALGGVAAWPLAAPAHAVLDHYAWRHHCRGLFQMPIAV